MGLNHFPDDFIWGAATAAYQIEGAHNLDGRGESIWDTFCRKEDKVLNMDNGDVACDHYHKYKEDVGLLTQLGADAYRFSIAWPRIIPGGTGEVNQKGIDFYNRLLDELLARNIEPYVTLYHWDLPQVLEDKGGWQNRETAFNFAEYAKVCFQAFGDRVKNWITLNEPMVSSYLGYFYGDHAPGIKDEKVLPSTIHHLNLAHGLSVKEFRDGGFKGKIGITLNSEVPRPASKRPEDVAIAKMRADLTTAVFLEPIFKKQYPPSLAEYYPDYHFPIEKGDLDIIGLPTDYLGLNYYTQNAVSSTDTKNRGFKTEYSPSPVSDMGWEIYPEGLYELIKWIHEEYAPGDMFITENGAACQDVVANDGHVHDQDRIDYLHKHLTICERVIKEGIPLKGYFAWSLMDNFEWAYGYSKRFGIVHIDYKTQKRTPKDSFYYLRDVITGHTLFS